MPAHGDEAACTGAGVRKPSMKETAMGEGLRGGLHYGDLSAAVDATWRTAERCRALADEDTAHE